MNNKNNNTMTLVMKDGTEWEVDILYVINIKDKGDYVIYKLDDDFYVADNFDSSKWDTRSLWNDDKLSDKEKIGLLSVCYMGLNLFTGKCGFIVEDKIKAKDLAIILIVNLIVGSLFTWYISKDK